MFSSPQMREAMVRAAYQAMGQGLAFFVAALAFGADLRIAALAGAGAALSALGFRGGYEGSKDAARARDGKVIESDIQAEPVVQYKVVAPIDPASFQQ